ncbi:MAG: aspartate kinase, partial [Flavobacteriales bacterium]
MEVYKFGGASVKDADAVKNVVEILTQQQGQRKVVVFSAMGKTTNMLERVHEQRTSLDNWKPAFEEVVKFHDQVAADLGVKGGELYEDYLREVNLLETWLKQPAPSNEHLDYDRIVASGELMSTLLIAAYLEKEGFNCEWMDVRNVIKTNSEHRAADVDWQRSKRSAEVLLAHLEEDPTRMVITQGFISQSKLGNTTTLGREGSDFSAAIIAHLLDAKSVTIWKDVPGMLNADPKWFGNTIEIPHISYSEVIELSYYGASVIHPKTIQPLQKKNIPLYVKSFNAPKHKGT